MSAANSTRMKALLHGKHIFIYANIETKQVIYSLRQTLTDTRLNQLPFIGKHSVPPTIRPDLWRPLCTVTFPTGPQGLSAYRKLRELRRLHELCWDHTSPEALKMSRKKRIRWLMDQKANAIADLAKVLEMQGEKGGKMAATIERRREEVERVASKKWAEIEALAQRADDGEVASIEANLETLKLQHGRRQEKEKARIEKAIAGLRTFRKKLLWAQRQVALRAETDAKITAEQAALAATKAEVEAAKEDAVAGKDAIETKELPVSENPVVTSVLPKYLRRPLPRPMTLDGVLIKWADIYDAEYAASWPEQVLHDRMGAVKRTAPSPNEPATPFPTIEEEQVREMENVVLDGESVEENEAQGKENEENEEDEEKKESKRSFLSKLNPFSRKGGDTRASA
ncbi:hypothetical protein AOQ84DRAFT_442183 [Glonium stellatum]|uniref:Large ribosomal subunit protein mL67 n=1 Tax=Glonium stellatum TaxID=574774 RepID=A0A8E2ESY9_9PEZI|nr:hypothetical protein AOQ84DRAFT_442183 [Glonium stellatum]